MDDQPLTPEELALIERLRNMPQPELRPAAVEKIQQQLFQELEAMTAASSAAASTTWLTLPKILAVAAVVVVIIVVSIGIVANQSDTAQNETATPVKVSATTPPPTATLEFTAEPAIEIVPTATTPSPSTTPDDENNCRGDGQDWDCSSVEVEGICINNNRLYSASFIVTNVGDPGAGDMDSPSEFRLFVNDFLVETGTLQIPGGGTAAIDYEGQLNDVVQLEVDQRPGHPGSSQPNAVVTLDCAAAPLVVVEGPVTEININIITIFDITIELAPDDPLLLQLEIGDIVRVQGSAEFEGNVVVIVVVNIAIVEYDNTVFVNLPAGCKLTGHGNGHIRCKGTRRTTDR